jgi:ParB family chromosome partitioning protein
MSIKDRLAKKTEGLITPLKDDTASSNPVGQTRLRTSPGQMLMVNSLMKESNEKVAQLEERLKSYEGALPARLIDAKNIVESKWANRIVDSFETSDFLKLKEEIQQAGGNVQPIKVRPLQGTPDKFEIVFGHRRHRACLELGIPVLAVIEEVSDQALFQEMDRENRLRQDLSPWEQGKMYRKALDEGLYTSLGELSAALGVDKGNISKALKLADLPDVVIHAFPSPLNLQYRWAKLLNDALQADPEGVLSRAKELAEIKDSSQSAKGILELILGTGNDGPLRSDVVIDNQVCAVIVSQAGVVSVEFKKGLLNNEKTKALHSVLREFLTT